MKHSVTITLAILTLALPRHGTSAELESQDIQRGRRLLDDRIDWPMYEDPVVKLQDTVIIYPPRLVPLWVQAMERPKSTATLRLSIAATVTKAFRDGVPGVLEQTSPVLLSMVGKPDPHPKVRLTAAQTLIALDIAEAAEPLLALNQVDGLEMILLTDPALARWDHKPARAVWLARLDADSTPARVRRSAIDALSVVGEPAAANQLQAIVVDSSTDVALRYAAARALGGIAESGLVGVARSFAGQDASIPGRLVAASLLKSHSDQAAQALLLTLAKDEEPAVAAIALRRLLQIDPKLVDPLLEELAASVDSGVRLLAVEGLREPATARAVTMLADLLNDVTPAVRIAARDQLAVYDKDPQLTGHVRQEMMRILGGDTWQGLVESAHLVGAVDHEPAADRLLELLTFDRDEVRLAAVVNLRRIAVQAAMDPLLDHCRGLAQLWKQGRPSEELHIREGEMSQAFQAFGVMVHRPADVFLRDFIHRKGSPYEAYPFMRTAAVWALTCMHTGDPAPDLAAAFAARVKDEAPFDTESGYVRAMAAIGLGKMNAVSQLPTLRHWADKDDPGDIPYLACRMAIGKLTGEPVVQFIPRHLVSTGWPLAPIEPPAAAAPADE